MSVDTVVGEFLTTKVIGEFADRGPVAVSSGATIGGGGGGGVGAQPSDDDLTAIAALAPADDALIQRKAGAWTSRTPAQVKADMSIGVGDVSGLDENTRDVIGTALVAGSGVAVTVDDPGNTITLAVGSLPASAITSGTLADARLGNRVNRIIPASRYDSSTRLGTPLFDISSNSNVGVPINQMFLSRGHITGSPTLSVLSVYIQSTALTSGQAFYAVCYNVDSDGMPSTLAWSQLFTTGTSTGEFTTTGLSLALPAEYYIGIHNPSTNAGSVTLAGGQALRNTSTDFAAPARNSLNASSQGATPPSTCATYQISSSSAAAKFAAVQYAPLVFGKV